MEGGAIPEATQGAKHLLISRPAAQHRNVIPETTALINDVTIDFYLVGCGPICKKLASLAHFHVKC